MSTNKLAMIRYQALDKCFRNKYKRFYMDDLISACNDALYDNLGPNHEVKRRQIFDDIKFMESSEGWNIPLDRIPDGRKVFYRYNKAFSINERPLSDEEMNILTQAVSTLGRFKGMPQFEWIETLVTNLEDKLHLKGNKEYIIGFEQNIDYLAAEHLPYLFNAILNRQTVHIQYKTFSGKSLNWDIHPYFIKQYNNRWFLFGCNNAHTKGVVTIPLDRIVSISAVQIPYIENTSIDFDEYFDDIIGVSIPRGVSSEVIRLRFTPERFPYIESKPIHGSMKIQNREEGIISIQLIPNNEFEALLLSFGNQVEVLEPLWLREKMRSTALQLLKIYSTCADGAHTLY